MCVSVRTECNFSEDPTTENRERCRKSALRGAKKKKMFYDKLARSGHVYNILNGQS